MLKLNLHIFLLIDNIIFLTVYVSKLALEHQDILDYGYFVVFWRL